MLLKITAKHQVTIPARVLDAMGVGPGDTLELTETPEGFIIRPRRIDYSRLGTLRGRFLSPVRRFISAHSATSPMTRLCGTDSRRCEIGANGAVLSQDRRNRRFRAKSGNAFAVKSP